MRRAGAFLAAAVGILAMALLVTGGQSILATGIVAVVAGLAFAAWPEAGMSVVGFVVCIPIVILQLVVGIPSGAFRNHQGLGQAGNPYTYHGQAKAVFVYPLTRDFRERLHG